MRHIATEASFSTVANQWWAAIPFVTSLVVAICSSIYAIGLLAGYDSFVQVCLLPYLVTSKFQVYRIYSSVVFHSTILHVAFNMLALVPIGSGLERVMGTVRFFHVILLMITSNGIIYVGIAFLAAHNPFFWYPDLLVQCCIGFSGVIFSLIVIETNLGGTQNRSIFGFFSVPAKLYPWALLFVFQLLIPKASLWGHLSGILSGFAYSFGLFDRALFGSSVYSAIESSTALGFLVRRPGFIVGGSNGSGGLPSLSNGSAGFQGVRNVWSGLQSMLPRREIPVDERFPGRGRTLSSVNVAPRQVISDVRNSNNNGQADLQARLLNRDTMNSSATEMQPVRTPPVIARQAGGGTPPSQTPNESPALQSLLAMGFDKTKAGHALSASNGDVTLAVEFLSAEGLQ